jgi:hypothetical protein
MSEIIKIKIEPLSDDNDEVEKVDCIVNNIKHEPEVEFLLLLPPALVKIEEFKKQEVPEQTQKERFQCLKCPKSFETRRYLYNH